MKFGIIVNDELWEAPPAFVFAVLPILRAESVDDLHEITLTAMGFRRVKVKAESQPRNGRGFERSGAT